MGIDIYVQSTLDSTWQHNCKTVFPYKWQLIFEIIRFQPTLLYDNSPNFWSTDQLEHVLKRLTALKDWEIEELNDEEIKMSINKLVELFEEYVQRRCIMIIY